MTYDTWPPWANDHLEQIAQLAAGQGMTDACRSVNTIVPEDKRRTAWAVQGIYAAARAGFLTVKSLGNKRKHVQEALIELSDKKEEEL